MQNYIISPQRVNDTLLDDELVRHHLHYFLSSIPSIYCYLYKSD